MFVLFEVVYYNHDGGDHIGDVSVNDDDDDDNDDDYDEDDLLTLG